MDVNKIVKIIVDLIGNLKPNDLRPSISYIINKILSIQTLKTLLTSELTPKEILQIGYMVYFIFEGDDYVSAEWKSKNDLYLLDVREINDVEQSYETCTHCDGSGYESCNTCGGSGEIECSQCDGTGIGDDDEECESCNGSGSELCEECDFDGEITCTECYGDQEVQSDEEYVMFDRELWVIGNPDTAMELKQIGDTKQFTDNFYDILDNDAGSVFLVKIIADDSNMEFNDFEYQYGDYYEIKDDYIIDLVVNLNKSSYSFSIDDRDSKNVTIR